MAEPRQGGARRAPRSGRASWGALIVSLAAALVFLGVYRPPAGIGAAPFAEATVLVPHVRAALSAFGRSGDVRTRFALPGEPVDYPLEVGGDPESLGYSWVRLADSAAMDSIRPLTGERLIAPPVPGFYQLAVFRDGVRRIVQDLTVTVLVPFEEKRGPVLDGYRIGTFLAERRATSDRPEGFIRIDAQTAEVPVSKHLRVGDFLTRDNQQVWPRFVAIDPRVLDKVELVLDAIRELRGDSADVEVEVDVHSGFRTPSYNARNRFALDSRHTHGDAIDIAIDANGDGRITRADIPLVAKAVEYIERRHPDLVGGMGLYTSDKYHQAFVHIDARGSRARWRG
ncbi:MAG TPA: D-Ala-D-Ala carboxypeptidase family metallohydrolase [Gemmatimonadaceae bacterium]|nr:D-Ala-D-Ala carboxypeptidase family metallohydrolase [Gemmatimonadaceae bacterium]